MIKYSFIVPMYNVEKYISQCIDSLLAQKYNNYEIIIIDDGSTDSSLSISKKYESKNKNIKVFSQENSGVSKARNRGLKEAKGEYIVFVDSDDYCSENLLTIIEQNINQNELLIYGYSKIYINKIENIVKKDSFETECSKEEYIILDDNIGGYISNKVFERRIIKENNIEFDTNIHYCEDLKFVCDYINKIKRIKYINKPLYYYRMRKGSATGSYLTRKNATILSAYEKLIDMYSQNKKIKELLEFSYIRNYYIFKKYITNKNENILNKEKSIIKIRKIGFAKLVKLLFIKHFNDVYLFVKTKIKKNNLFD